MKRSLLSIAVLCGMAGSAQAATLTVTPDASTYSVGQTITLLVVGDAQGGSTNTIHGRLVYSAALTDPSGIAPTQNTHTFASGPAAVGRALRQAEGYGSSGLGYSEAFDQIFSTSTPRSPLQNTTATIKLIAANPGTLNFSWEKAADGRGNHLLYYGLVPAEPAATVTVVPEPGTTLPLALGLFGLLVSPRRRRSR